MIEQLLMSRIFRRYIEAWAIVLMPWILFSERKAVTMDGFSPSEDDWLTNGLADGTLPKTKSKGFGPHTCVSACHHELS